MKRYILNKGLLIVIEGIDGAGKTTQAFKLKDYYSKLGMKVTYLKEPTNGTYGHQIKQLALYGRHQIKPEDELDLFIKDRIEDCELNIIPALDKKELVILDRYFLSTIAYQGALGLNVNDILKKNLEIAVKPDIAIVLDVAAKIGLSRIQNLRKEQHNHFEKEEYLEDVRKIFNQMEASYIQIIDASRDIETVFKNLKNIIDDVIAPYWSVDDRQLYLFDEKKDDNDLIKFNYH